MSESDPVADGKIYRVPSYIMLFDQINIAHCAAKRAKDSILEGDRFNREYDTARMWATKKVACL
jgi:hypothetical protein